VRNDWNIAQTNTATKTGHCWHLLFCLWLSFLALTDIYVTTITGIHGDMNIVTIGGSHGGHCDVCSYFYDM